MPLRVVRLGGRISLVLMCLGDTASYIVVSNMVCRAAEMSPQKVRYCYDSLDAEIVLPSDFTSFQHSATAESVTQDRHVSVSYYGTI